ncbi:MAG: peptide chain release factor N(5)-glutamine methyltransferase [Treponema sp.]|nr:peptide chain release factor N(5)-glutamine methyltransferase [Treponema sp.]
MIIREALSQGTADLKFAEIKTPGLDASLLLSHVLNKSRSELLASSSETLSETACEEYCALIERRCFGECAAYLTGKKEFFGLDFKVNHSVLVPRPDTETLVEQALIMLGERSLASSGTDKIESRSANAKRGAKVLDLCAGSGAIAVALKHEKPEIEIHAADISSEALEVAKENAARLLGENKMFLYHGDLFDALSSPVFGSLTPNSELEAPNKKFNLIVSNPPYIPSNEIETLSAEARNEPRIALDGGASGIEIINRIIDNAPEYLENSGVLLMEADPRQMDSIKILLENKGFKSIKTYNDLSSSERVIGGVYEK